MAGWIKDHRKELESDIWQLPPMYHRVWQWIKYSVNHSDGKIPNKSGGFTIIKAGQRATSYRQIARGVGYYEGNKWVEPNPKTIKQILQWLKQNGNISIYGNSKGTVITLINWDYYQQNEIGVTAEKQYGNTKETPKKHAADTNKNDKECKRMNKNEKKDIYRDFAGEDLELFEALKAFEEMRKTIKKPLTDRAKELSINKLKKISSDSAGQIEIVNRSVLNSWQSFYELKGGNNGRTSTSDSKNAESSGESEEDIYTKRLKELGL